MIFTCCSSLLISLGVHLIQPDNILTVESNQLEQTINHSQELLLKARSLKQSGDTGYGAMYRRAAWASLGTSNLDPTRALAILSELQEQPESVFDQWDGLRIAGRTYLILQDGQLATQAYEQAEQLTITDPSLIDSHPLVFIEIMQMLSSAHALLGDYPKAAQCAIRLRDHSNTSVHRDHRLLATQSACNFWFQAQHKDQYLSAWNVYIERFPSLFEDNQGIRNLIEHARAMSELGDELTVHLEQLFANPRHREHSSFIEIGEELAWAWIERNDAPESHDHAYSTLGQTWEVIKEHKDLWLESAGPHASAKAPIVKQIKSFIGWYASIAFGRGDRQTLEMLGLAYGSDFGYDDGEALNMLNLIQNP